MSNKLEQMNIRLSETLKKNITNLAEKKGLKTSDFVRQTLEEAIEGKSSLEITNLLKSNFSNREKIILQAVAFIAHTDTDQPLIDCLRTALEVAEEKKINQIADPINVSREEREKITLEINKVVAEKLQVSSQALTYIRLLLTTYMGLLYNEDIFRMTPLSMLVMEEIKEQLDDKKKTTIK